MRLLVESIVLTFANISQMLEICVELILHSPYAWYNVLHVTSPVAHGVRTTWVNLGKQFETWKDYWLLKGWNQPDFTSLCLRFVKDCLSLRHFLCQFLLKETKNVKTLRIGAWPCKRCMCMEVGDINTITKLQFPKHTHTIPETKRDSTWSHIPERKNDC